MQMDLNYQMKAQNAEALRLSGAYEKAIEIFEDILKEPKYIDNGWLNAHLGATYCKLMNYGKAIDSLEKALEKNDKYLWAHAQLGETYRLLAIVNNRKPKYIEQAIAHFKRALDAEKPEDSNSAWALAHLGATYRLKITSSISLVSQNKIKEESKEDALKCLDRAIELMPTYAWAWGMRSTVYRLTKEYENSFWDLGVEAVIAPALDIMQQSSSPVAFLESKRVNLYEHAFMYFYLSKKKEEVEHKKIQYARAIACLEQALILRPGDLIARLVLIVIETNQKIIEAKQKKEKTHPGKLDPADISEIAEKIRLFFKDAEDVFSQNCQKVLRYLMKVPEPLVTLDKIKKCVEEGSILTKLVLQDVINNPDLKVTQEEAQLWVWKNFAWTEICSSVLFLLGDFVETVEKEIDLKKEIKIALGTARHYQYLAAIINPYHCVERLYQTPIIPEKEKGERFEHLKNVIPSKLYDPSQETLITTASS